jgi:chromosome condensin MukBEF ATPase and DNA-binding subunit MukB
MAQLNGTTTIATGSGDAFYETSDVGSESDHQLRQYENHLRRMEQHNDDDDLEELRSQLEEKIVEVADLRQKVEKLQSGLHQRDDEVDRLRQQHQIDIDKVSTKACFENFFSSVFQENCRP